MIFHIARVRCSSLRVLGHCRSQEALLTKPKFPLPAGERTSQRTPAGLPERSGRAQRMSRMVRVAKSRKEFAYRAAGAAFCRRSKPCSEFEILRPAQRNPTVDANVFGIQNSQQRDRNPSFLPPQTFETRWRDRFGFAILKATVRQNDDESPIAWYGRKTNRPSCRLRVRNSLIRCGAQVQLDGHFTCGG